jgi:hypothetical protein
MTHVFSNINVPVNLFKSLPVYKVSLDSFVNLKY